MSPWFALAAMSLATFILTKLIVDLDFPPVLWLRDRVVGGWRLPTLAQTYHESYPVGELEEGVTKVVPRVGMFTLVDGEIHVWNTRNKRIPYFFAELMSCPWCVSAYAAAAVVTGTWLTIGLPAPVLMWLCTWATGALLAQHDWS